MSASSRFWAISIALFLFSNSVGATISGTISVPSGSYSTIASVISALNSSGIGSGGVTVNVAAGYTETISATLSLTATGTSSNPIIFQKSGTGANPLITAYTGGTGTPGSASMDGIWQLVGSDYVTINGIDLAENSANTSNPSTMEYGYGLFKGSATDGCQYNTIKNCVVSLSIVNNAAGTAPMVDGSVGILAINATSSAATTALTITASSGANSYNKFYSNTVQNCNIGIALIGFADISPFSYADDYNDVGGSSASTGNQVLNFGGATSASNPAAGVRTLAQYDFNVSYNTMNNNTGTGVNHPNVIRGIYVNTATSANANINNNTVTIKNGGTTTQVSAIENVSGATAAGNTISISNNTIQNCTNDLATTGIWYGIYNNAASANTLTMSGNSFINNSSKATSATNYLLYNSGAVAGSITISNNNFSANYTNTAAYTGTLYSLYNGSGTTTTNLTIANNNFSNYVHTITGTGSIYFIYNGASCFNTTFDANTWTNLSMNHSGTEYFIYNSSSTQLALNVTNNAIVTGLTRTAAFGTMYCYYAGSSSLGSSTQTFSGNNFSNINCSVAGTGTFYGFYNLDGASSPYPQKSIFNNTISNVNVNSTGTFYGFYTSYLGDGGLSTGSAIYNNTLNNITWTGTMYCLYPSSTVSPTYPVSVYGNTVSNITSNGASSSVYGAYVFGGGAGLNFYKNRFFNISETGTSGVANGMYIGGGITSNFFNNYIGDIRAVNSTSTNAVNGIYLSSCTTPAISYNTVYINNATVSTTTSGSSGLYVSSTSPALSLRDNIIVNTSTAGPTGGIVAAFRYTSYPATTSYTSVSNNNLFYTGTPSSTNLIYTEGTAATATNGQQTLAAYKTYMGSRDANSISIAPTFLSTTGGAANYLHINAAVPTIIESGGVNVAGITDDYDGDTRQGNTGYLGTGTLPDIGADEFNGTTPAPKVNSVAITPTGNLCASTVRTVTASVSQGTAALTSVTLNYSLNGGTQVPVTMTGGSLTGTSTWSGIIPVAAPANATVTWNVTASDGTYSATATGTSYKDAPLFGVTATAVATSANVPCPNSADTIWANIAVSNPAPTYTAPPAVTYPTTDEDLANITITQGANTILNNTSTYNSLVGTIGTAIGTAGSYSDFSSFGPYNLTAGQTYSFSATTYQATTAYGNSIGIYIDYNKNGVFTDPGEQVYASSTTTSGAHTETGSFTVPTSAAYGSTRMRIVVNEGSITGPTQTVNWGEYEEYMMNISPSVTAYSWSNGTSTVATTDTAIVHPPATTNYTCTLTAAGCPLVSSPVTISVPANPLVITPASAAVCVGSNVALSATGAVSYTWSPSATLSASTGANVTATPTTTTTYTINGTTAAGCIYSTTKQVVVNPLPTIIVTPSTPVAVCPGFGAILTGNGAVSYTWTPSSTLSSGTGTVVTATPTATTTYTVTGTDANGCVNTGTKQVVVYTPPTVNISPTSATSVCIGLSTTLTASGTSTSYAWSPAAGLSATTGSSVTATPAATTTYTVTGTDVNGCTNTASKLVTVNPLPTVGVSPTTATAVCIGSGIALSGTGAVSYTWAPGASLSATSGVTVTASPTTATTYTITGTDANGCVNTATKLVTVNALPTISVSPATAVTFCAGGSAGLSATGGIAYVWSPASGLSATVGAAVTASPTATTTYTVTGTDGNGCSNTATKLITINPLPTLSVTPTTPITFCASTGSSLLTATGATTYTWSPSTGLSATTGSSVTASPTSTTTYTVTGTDLNGCVNSTTKLISINPLPVVTIAPATTTTICSGNTVSLTASSSSAISYSWSPALGLGTTTGATVAATPLTTTTYTVTATDAAGCSGTASKLINVNLSPTISVNPSSPAICIGSSVSLAATGAVSYSWTPTSGLSSGTAATVTASPTTSTSYTVVGTAANGCTGSTTASVTVNPLPTISITPTGASLNLCTGSSLTMNAFGATTYSWSPATGLGGLTTGPSVTTSTTTTTTYTVSGTDLNGCVNIATKQVVVKPLPTVGISPSTIPVICNGSSTTLVANGSLTYVWTPAASLSSPFTATTSASPGATTIYTVTGTDAFGCVNTATKQVTVNPLPVVGISPLVAATICSGGGITLTASGANTYVWTPSTGLSSTTTASVNANPTATITYTVTGTDGNGCVNTATKLVTVNGLPTVTITPSTPVTFCQGLNANLTANGAATYVWSPATGLSGTSGSTVNASPAATTTYTVTGTATNGCINTATKLVTILPAPDPTITPAGYTNICQDDTVHYAAVPGYTTYIWQLYGVPIQTGSSSTLNTWTGGFYTLKITDGNGCIAVSPAPAVINVTQHPVAKIKKVSANLDAGAGFATYQWYRGGTIIPGSNTRTYAATIGGSYTVLVSDTTALHCSGMSAPFIFTGVGVNSNPTADAIQIYPNPANDLVYIHAPMPVSVTVSSMDGKQLLYSENATMINIGVFADGIYRLVIRSKDGEVLKTEKVQKISR